MNAKSALFVAFLVFISSFDLALGQCTTPGRTAIIQGSFYTPDLYNNLVARGVVVDQITAYDATVLSQYSAIITYGNTFWETTSLQAWVNAGGIAVLTPWAWNNGQSPWATFGATSNAQFSIPVPSFNVLQSTCLLNGVTFPAPGSHNIGREGGRTHGTGVTPLVNYADDGTAFLNTYRVGNGWVISINAHYITSDCAIVGGQPWAVQLVYNAISYRGTGVIRVGIANNGIAADTGRLGAIIDDDTYYNFNVTYFPLASATAAYLTNFDVLVLGCDGNAPSIPATNLDNIVAFVQGGKGLVVTAWFYYSSNALGALNPLLPFNTGGYQYCTASTTLTVTGTHPVTSGITSITYANVPVEIPTTTLNGGATSVASVNGCGSGDRIAAVQNYGNGRTVYLGYAYGAGDGYGAPTLRSTALFDRLMENSLSWAASGVAQSTTGTATTGTPTTGGGGIRRVGIISDAIGVDAGRIGAMIDDDTYYSFTVSYLTLAQATPATLANYDVLVIGSDGTGSYPLPATNLDSIVSFVQNGGGLVTNAWFYYAATSHATLNPVLAFNVGSYEYCTASTVFTVTGTHPVTAGITSISYSGVPVEIPTMGLNTGAVSLATVNGCNNPTRIAAAQTYGNGRSVYLGYAYGAGDGYGAPVLRATAGFDRLLENAAYWAGARGQTTTTGTATTGTMGTKRVGIVSDGIANDQGLIGPTIDDDTYYSFTVTYFTMAQATPAFLTNFDVILLGNDGYGATIPATNMNNIVAFVQNGGGLVTNAWFYYSTTTLTMLNPIIPFNVGGYDYCTASTILTVTGTHPVTAGISTIPYSGIPVEIPTNTFANGATSLATVDGCGNPSRIVAANTAGAGRVVYLGFAYGAGANYGAPTLRSTPAFDRLLENSLAWAAGQGGGSTTGSTTGATTGTQTGCGAARRTAIVSGSFYTSQLYNSLVARGVPVTEITSYDAAILSNVDVLITYGNTFYDPTALTTWVNNGGVVVLTPWAWANGQSPFPTMINGPNNQYNMPNPGITVVGSSCLLDNVVFPAPGSEPVGREGTRAHGTGTIPLANYVDDGTAFLNVLPQGLGYVISINAHYITSDCAIVGDKPWAVQLMVNAAGYGNPITSTTGNPTTGNPTTGNPTTGNPTTGPQIFGCNPPGRIAIVQGDWYTPDLYNSLLGRGVNIEAITSYDASILGVYDAVITYGNTYYDAASLDSYVQAGGRVILTPWAWGNGQSPYNTMDGTYASEYTIVNPGFTVLSQTCLLTGVTLPDAGAINLGREGTRTHGTGTNPYVDYADGTAFLNSIKIGNGFVISINAHYITSDCAIVGGQDWAVQLVVNALGFSDVITTGSTTGPSTTGQTATTGITSGMSTTGITCPIECPDGRCVNTVAECAPPPCPFATPFRCADGTCVSSPAYCAPTNCDITQVQCWDGTCAATREDCAIIGACTGNTPKRCQDGSCAGVTDTCPTNNCGALSCPDGSCVQTEEECGRYNGCPTNYLLCTSGRCVLDFADCNCDNGGVSCFDGTCQNTPDQCPVPPGLIKPIEFNQEVDVTIETNFDIPATDGQIIATIVVPGGAIQTQGGSSATIMITAVADSQIRETFTEGWPADTTPIENIFSPTIDLDLGDGATLVQPIEITFAVTLPPNVNEDEVCLALLNEQTNQWECQDTTLTFTIDQTTGQQVATGTISDVGTVAVIRNPSEDVPTSATEGSDATSLVAFTALSLFGAAIAM